MAIHIKREYNTDKKQVFCIGCKGIPAQYGGFETFMENLTLHKKSEKLRYHVAAISNKDSRYEYNGAKCYNVKVPEIGSAKAVIYDAKALSRAIRYCRERPSIKEPVFFIMACRIGPFIGYYKRKIKRLGGYLYINPDGHDWERRKWPAPVRKYWKLSEHLMIKHADKVICDSREIEKYIRQEYKRYNPNTTYIAYGADLEKSTYADSDSRFTDWLLEHNTSPKEYYLVVGRFVKENNFDTIIREFLKSKTKRKLIIITTDNPKLLDEMNRQLHFLDDDRVQIADSIYDKQLLKKIREQAYAYIHGHEVGGTNPSLLEAMASTDMNLVFDVSYNREVTEDAAIYWNKRENSMRNVLDMVDIFDETQIAEYGEKSKGRIREYYSWNRIAYKYEYLFENDSFCKWFESGGKKNNC
ncbi:MAG: DUF1972 domain-containing protein [Butyrivibrio sp.]|nr:DUF1972 domain-containing protein [Butyrivibrio sp.]